MAPPPPPPPPPQWEINEPLQELVVVAAATGLLYLRSGCPIKNSSTVEMAAAAAQTK